LPDALGAATLFGGVDREASSSIAGPSTDFWGDWSFPVPLGGWTLQPGVGLRYARYARHAWSESGADALSLSAQDQFLGSSQADFGVRVMRASGRFRPNASAAYRRELTSGQTSTTLQLTDRPDGIFTINGIPLSPDTLTMRAGFVIQGARVDLSLAYEARRAFNQTRQAVQFGAGF
jgi:uncharacterized protein with beta-barrel porin domain